MEYIINPMWFYWIEVADTIKEISIGAMFVLLISAIIILAATSSIDDEFERKYAAKTKRNVMVLCLIGLAVSALVCIIVPSRDTLISMQIAKLATHDNINLTADKIKEIVDYIISAVKEIK